MAKHPADPKAAFPGPLCQQAVERLAQSECPALTMRRKRRAEQSGSSHDPIVWSEATGSTVLDMDGRPYIDLCASFGSAILGHRHPRVQRAIEQQLHRVWQALGDLHPSDVKIKLLERLCKLAPWNDSRAMLGLSGSDALEAALKTAVLHTGKTGVLAFSGGYHGLSYGALSVSDYNPLFRAPFLEQLNPKIAFAPYPSADQSEESFIAILEKHCGKNIGAICIEVIQARGGVHIAPDFALPTLRQWCDQNHIVLIVDEIYTGLGRCGQWWLSMQGTQCFADIICIGKALGGGLPVSACIGRNDVMQAWANSGPETIHTSTFAGYPLGCAAALGTLHELEHSKWVEHAKHLGTQWLHVLEQNLGNHPEVVAVRGQGLLVGIELKTKGSALVLYQRLLRKGFITLMAGNDARVIQCSPPLTIDPKLLLHDFVLALQDCLKESYGC